MPRDHVFLNNWFLPGRTPCESSVSCASLLPAPGSTQVRIKNKIIEYIQNIYICINSKFWKEKKNQVLIFYFLLKPQKKKKKKVKAVLILSRPVHKSQVINPHDIPGCWILHLELWNTDSWKIYKIPVSQSAPYWLHIWGVPASCLAQWAWMYGIYCAQAAGPPSSYFQPWQGLKFGYLGCLGPV